MFDDQTGICGSCGCKTEEFLQARVHGDQVRAVFVPPGSFQDKVSRHQGVTVCFKGIYRD